MSNRSTEEQRFAEPVPIHHVVGPVLGALVVLAAAGVLVWSGLTTASGRISATTTNESSLLQAAQVDLVVEAAADVASTGLLLDGAGLYPGLGIERCLHVSYWGPLPDAQVRLYGRSESSTGLERYISTTVEAGSASSPDCTDFVAASTLFDGTLGALWEAHGDFLEGLPVLSDASDGADTWLRISAEVLDDNDAQGRSAAFWLVLEARP